MLRIPVTGAGSNVYDGHPRRKQPKTMQLQTDADVDVFAIHEISLVEAPNGSVCGAAKTEDGTSRPFGADGLLLLYSCVAPDQSRERRQLAHRILYYAALADLDGVRAAGTGCCQGAAQRCERIFDNPDVRIQDAERSFIAAAKCCVVIGTKPLGTVVHNHDKLEAALQDGKHGLEIWLWNIQGNHNSYQGRIGKPREALDQQVHLPTVAVADERYRAIHAHQRQRSPRHAFFKQCPFP
ncbi:MAG: hypothetical protein EOO23_06005 [Comamonadaceae bacterium]|nr:MAG: hypothetical protein EOO23_06005 [Comamonadaceae bacterium]